jgi:hypothetical protein
MALTPLLPSYGRKHFPEEFAVYWNAAQRYTTRKVQVDVIRQLKAVGRRHLAGG